MNKPIKVYLGWPSTGQREDYHLYMLRDLQERYKEYVELVLPDMCVHRIFHDFARNSVVEEFLASDCDVLWMLDSDVCPPHHILDLIAHHYDKWQVAGAPYPVYQSIPGTEEMSICFTVYKGLGTDVSTNNRGIKMADVPQDGTEFVDGLATGCVFIKREVFDKLEQPYFEFKFDPTSRRVKEGEDLGFAMKLADLGIKFFVDYSMACEHYKRIGLLQMNNYAIKMNNVAISKYDQQVRGQVEQAIQAAYQAGLKKGKEQAVPSGQLPAKAKSNLILPSHLQV